MTTPGPGGATALRSWGGQTVGGVSWRSEDVVISRMPQRNGHAETQRPVFSRTLAPASLLLTEVLRDQSSCVPSGDGLSLSGSGFWPPLGDSRPDVRSSSVSRGP